MVARWRVCRSSSARTRGWTERDAEMGGGGGVCGAAADWMCCRLATRDTLDYTSSPASPSMLNSFPPFSTPCSFGEDVDESDFGDAGGGAASGPPGYSQIEPAKKVHPPLPPTLEYVLSDRTRQLRTMHASLQRKPTHLSPTSHTWASMAKWFSLARLSHWRTTSRIFILMRTRSNPTLVTMIKRG